MAQTLFFALKEDILPVLEDFDSMGSWKYVPTGFVDSLEYQTFGEGAGIPNLGVATRESAVGCESYLVCASDMPVNLRKISPVDGGIRYAIDQLINPDTITLTPAGIWNDEIVLHGRVGTASRSESSRLLMRRFRSALKKHFVKVKAFYVGPRALVLLKEGKRLTIAAQSSGEFDLRLD
jgi:hypothetical protein